MERIVRKIQVIIDPMMDDREEYDKKLAELRKYPVQVERTPIADVSTREKLKEEQAELEVQLKEIGDRVKTGIIGLSVRALSRFEYLNLLKKHAPRDEEPLDARFGYNVDTFGGALLRAATVAAHDSEGEPIELKLNRWLDDEDGVSAADFEAWFKLALSLQTQPSTSFPLGRVS